MDKDKPAAKNFLLKEIPVLEYEELKKKAKALDDLLEEGVIEKWGDHYYADGN